VQLQLRRAESAQRGYLSTLRSDFQSDFEAAASRLIPALQRLSELSSDIPFKSPRRRMLSLSNERSRNSAGYRTARTERIDDAAQIVREGIGRAA